MISPKSCWRYGLNCFMRKTFNREDDMNSDDIVKELEEFTRLWKIQQERAWETGYLAGAEDCIDDINDLITKLRNEG